ncbi:arginine decarboxylase, partial [Klebsiella pneumoniae]|nr:arginine decarboxylase [Klebsiella pneumoniae]
MLEDWHDAEDIREEALGLFRHGLLDLRTRAQIESLYWSICSEVAELVHHQKHAPDELRKLDKMMSEKYFCNFSLFQSLPDHWALDQL